MTIDEFNQYLNSLPDKIMDIAPNIVAETAVEYFKQRFTEKSFDGNPWVAGKPKSKGSLLIESGKLLNSIRPSEVSQDRVVISAGNDKVSYAKAHNEGVNETVRVSEHYRQTGETRTKVFFSLIKSHDRKMNIPQRQFVGVANELMIKIKQRIDALIESIV